MSQLRMLAMVTLLLSGCRGVNECAGGTQVAVENQTSTTLTVEFTRVDFGDAGLMTEEVGPGESVDLINAFSIGGQMTSASSIRQVRISDATAVLYEGAVAEPAFELTTFEGGGCRSATYIFSATP